MAHVLISGASRGLGLALANEFDRRGHNVSAGVRGGAIASDTIKTIKLNVRDEAAVNATVAGLGRIDVLINNAGYHVGGSLESISQDDFKHVLDVNVLGVWRLTRAALPLMPSGSTIVMISSLSGLVGLPDDGAYAASKFALEGMSQSLAAEVASRGIRVIVVEPGAIATGFAGSTKGVTTEAAAIAIANMVATPSSALRHPLGEEAGRIAAALDLDTGSRIETVVKMATGRDWQPKMVGEG